MTSVRLAGFWPLLRFALRRDRVKLPAWVLGIGAFTAYCSFALKLAVPVEADLQSLSGLLAGPAGIVLVGPGYGFEHPTYASVFAGAYGLYVMVLGACAAILLAVRHTRGEEGSERLELVRALPVHRWVPLTVAIVMLGLLSLLVTVVCFAVLVASFTAGSSALFAAGVGMVTLVFGAVALIAGQLTAHARSAAGIAFAVFGLAFMARAVGDVLGGVAGGAVSGGKRGSGLSWVSPFAWAQQTRAFVDDRWWPLALGVPAVAAAIALAVVLQGRRDMGVGLVPARSGRAGAPPLLRGPFSLALTQQRGSLIGWTVAAVLAGAAYGSLANQIPATLGTLRDPTIVVVLGGDTSRIVDGYLAVCLLFSVILGCGYAIFTLQRLGAEERSGRAELMLSFPLGRVRWALSFAAGAFAGGTVVLAAGGFATGLSAALTLHEADETLRIVGATLEYLPAVLVVTAVAFLAYTIRPGFAGLAWLAVGYGYIATALGPALKFPDWALRASVLYSAGMPPLTPPHTAGQWVLVGVACALIAGACVRIRTRNLNP